MTRSQSDSWSITRSLAFLAAVFAIVLSSLLPVGAMAATPSGQVMLCSDAARMATGAGGDQGDGGGKASPAHCPACIMPLTATLPNPPVQQAAAIPDAVRTADWTAGFASPPPPARGPPRPPSTAPPAA
ncbi:DUF2946 family protein [Brevundimonas sp. Root1423]|uniref:DUF2946 family protein n=1 Tax=Brevundimonas sp. Root1423 TaxID=1736462 RepID=UPI0009EA0439|nr:DUF2946 family protein [Brevundimonas sp. Root1423]